MTLAMAPLLLALNDDAAILTRAAMLKLSPQILHS
jgi:hypothetical protein